MRTLMEPETTATLRVTIPNGALSMQLTWSLLPPQPERDFSRSKVRVPHHLCRYGSHNYGVLTNTLAVLQSEIGFALLSKQLWFCNPELFNVYPHHQVDADNYLPGRNFKVTSC